MEDTTNVNNMKVPRKENNPHFITRVDDVRNLISDVHLLVDEFGEDLKPYSKSVLTEDQKDEGDVGFASDLDKEIYALESEVESLRDKIENLMEKFNG